MTMRRRFFSGDSLSQAVNQAAQHFQVPAAEIEYKQVEKRHGFLKVRRKVVIEVDESNPFRSPEREGAAASASTETASSSSDTWSEVVRAPSAGEREPAESREEPEPRAGRIESRADSDETRQVERPRATSWFDIDPTDEVLAVEVEPSPEPEPEVESAGVEPGLEAAATEQYEAEEPDRAPAQPAEPESREPEAKPERARRSRGGRGGRGRGDGSRRVELAEAPPAAKARYSEAQGEEAEAAAEALDRILKLAGLVLESEILQAEEHLQVELRGADQDLLLRDRGRLLLAIQHLLPRAIRGLIGRSVVCKVDSDNYHEIREERLRDMAQRAADDVRDRGRPKTLEPMSPDERRIVHLTLADYPGVETESHGSGLFKRVMVRSVSGSRAQRSEGYRR